MTEELKGFRRNKDLTKKQVLKQKESDNTDMQKLLYACQMLMERNNESEKRLAQLESRIDVVVPVIEFEYTGLIKLLATKGILFEDELAESIERQRVDYMTRCEAETDKQLNLIDVERPAQEGDIVIVSFSASDTSGNAVKEMSTNYFMTTIGITDLMFPQLMPNLNSALINMVPGERKDHINVHFPDDYKVNPRVAGQTLHFSLTLSRLKEKRSADEKNTNSTSEKQERSITT